MTKRIVAQTYRVGDITFIATEPEPEPEPKPQPEPKPEPKPRRPSAPQCTASRCTMSSSKRGPDGYYHMGYIADRMWTEHNKPRWKKVLGW